MVDASGQIRIVVSAIDVTAMRRHYEGSLGLEVIEVFEGDHGVRLRLRGDTQIQLINANDTAATTIHLSVEVPSIDEAYRQVADVADGPPETQPWGHRNFHTSDPEGNAITFFEVVDEPS